MALRSRILVRLMLASFTCTLSVYLLASDLTLFRSYLPQSRRPLEPADVLLVLKIGSTEVSTKLPVHYDRLLAWFPQRLIFSDYEQICDGYNLRDAIADVGEETKASNKDFDIYREIQEAMAAQPGNTTALQSLMGSRAWTLDKWKFLPIIHKATETMQQAECKWLVLVEADSAVSPKSLLHWLRGLDDTKPLFLGHEHFLRGEKRIKFAHGGSGVVLSRKALEVLRDTRRRRGELSYDRTWEQTTSHSVYGDVVLTLALAEAGVPLT